MPGSPSPNKGYIIPTVFGDLNLWGGELNSNFTNIDLNIGGTASVAISGTTWAVSGTTLQNSGFKFTGSLAATNTVTFSSYAGFAFIQNGTSGGQQVICNIAGGATVTVNNGESIPTWCDGLNFYRLSAFGGGTSTTGTGAVVLANNASVSNLSGILPPGIIVPYGGTAAPSGFGTQWLFCDGSAVSRTTFSALFSVCGTSYGAGNGSTTFNVPDLRGRVAIGYDAGNATGRMTNISAATLGAAGGEQSHTLVVAELAIHNHGVTDPGHNHSHNDPSHAHGVADPTHAHSVADPGHNHSHNDPSHAHSVSDPQHIHGLGDPGHAHGVADPGHTHGSTDIGFVILTSSAAVTLNVAGPYGVTSTGATAGAGTGIGIFGAGTGLFMGYSPTNIGIFGSFTGITNNAAGTSIGIFANATGIGISGNFTGITNNAAGTSLSVNNAGSSSGHNNTQPGVITGYLIKT